MILMSFFWLGGIFFAPALAHSHPSLSSFLYNIYSLVCHQQPERSFSFAGHKLGVCSRCTGIYLTFFLTLLFYLFKTKRFLNLRVFILLLLPTVLEKSLEIAGFVTGNWSRFISGTSFGILLGMAFSEGFLDFMQRRFK